MKMIILAITLILVSLEVFCQSDTAEKQAKKYKYFKITKILNNYANELQKKQIKDVVIFREFVTHKPLGFIYWTDGDRIKGMNVYQQNGKYKKRMLHDTILSQIFLQPLFTEKCQIEELLKNKDYNAYLSHDKLIYIGQRIDGIKKEFYFRLSTLNNSSKSRCLDALLDVIWKSKF